MQIIAMTGGRVNRSRRHSTSRQSWLARIRLDPILDLKFEKSGASRATAGMARSGFQFAFGSVINGPRRRIVQCPNSRIAPNRTIVRSLSNLKGHAILAFPGPQRPSPE